MPLDKIASFVTSLVGGAVKPVLDKFVGDKMSDAEKAQMQLALEESVSKAVQKEKDSFFEFVIEHSGAAKDMPWVIQVLRGSVRPVITYAVVFFDGWFIWQWLNMRVGGYDPEAFSLVMKLLLASTMIVLGFWFGERLLTRSGIAQALLGKKNGQ